MAQMLFRDIRLFPELKNEALFRVVAKMLVVRGLLAENDKDKTVKSLVEKYDKFVQSSTIDGFVTVVVVNGKLASLGKASGINSILNNESVPLKLVIVESIQTNARKSILQYPNTEVFTMVELLANPCDHVLVPKHRRLSPEEKEGLQARVSISQLPRIESTDIVVRYLGLKPWDIIAIERVSPTTGLAVYYRVVIPVA